MSTTTGGERRRLGRGLSALVGTPVPISPPGGSMVGQTRESASSPDHTKGTTHPTTESGQSPIEANDVDSGGILDLSVESIDPSPFQPRRRFDEQLLIELSASIQTAGLVQPVLVRPLPTGRYELIAGERRWRASKLAGLDRVPCVVRRASDEQAAEWALIENLQRTDLSAMERAYAIKGLADRFGHSHAQLAERLGIERSSVTNMIRLTELEGPIQALIERGSLSGGHGKALLSIEAGADRSRLAEYAAEGGLSVRALEDLIAAVRGGATLSSLLGTAVGPKPRAQASMENKPTHGAGDRAASEGELQVRDLEKRLGETLGTKVRIVTRGGKGAGELRIAFYGLDHFEGLMDRIGCARDVLG